MEKNELRVKIYSKIDELPTLPAVIPKLLSLMESTTSDVSSVTEAISRDPALTSKILKVANSAYYGFPQGITDLKRAVALLGFNMVKSLALSIGVLRSLPQGQKTSLFSQEELWFHSVAVATAMKEMGRKYGQGNDHEYLFIVGLLHDIGMVVLDQFFSELFEKALEEARTQERREFYLAERRVIGFDHGEVGAMLLERWRFPEVISSLIAVHHQPEIQEGPDITDIAMLRIADALSHELDPKKEAPPMPLEIQDADLKALHMKEKDIDDLKAYLHDEKDGINAFFNTMI